MRASRIYLVQPPNVHSAEHTQEMHNRRRVLQRSSYIVMPYRVCARVRLSHQMECMKYKCRAKARTMCINAGTGAVSLFLNKFGDRLGVEWEREKGRRENEFHHSQSYLILKQLHTHCSQHILYKYILI